MMTSTATPVLIPRSRQFPFDAICERILRELEARNWSVPGITVEFYNGREGRYVNYIKGDGFKLWFCRGYNNASVSEITLPGKELNVYDDESGPTLYVYVGKNWQKDKVRFLEWSKVNSKLNREPRTYLKYKGGCNCQRSRGASFDAIGLLTGKVSHHYHSGRREPFLFHDNDLGREYDPRGKEPKSYSTDAVFAEFTRWLQETLLGMIIAPPVGKIPRRLKKALHKPTTRLSSRERRKVEQFLEVHRAPRP